VPKISIGDVQLYYKMTEARPPLLSIHGPGSSSRQCEKQVAFSSTTHRIQVVMEDAFHRGVGCKGRHIC
jgi:hypothetical protein